MGLDRSAFDEWVAFGRRVVALVVAEQVTFLAAGIAYYAFVSVFPLLLLVLAVGSLVGGEALAERTVAALGGVLSPVGESLVRESVVSTAGRTPATLLSVTLLGWSTLKVFRGLDVAFSQIYGTSAAGGFVDQATDAAVVMGCVGVAVVSLVTVNVAVARAGVVVAGVFGTVVLIAVLATVFFPLFYLFPDVRVAPTEVLPGTVLAAAGWTVLGTAFGTYAGIAGATVYGVIGGVLLLVTWFYVASIVLLAGAVLNATLAGVVVETGNAKRPPADTSANERS